MSASMRIEGRQATCSAPLSDQRVTLQVFCVALAAVLSLVAALWFLYPPRYLTNDDVAIRLGIEGKGVPGQPATGFVLMTHSALGWALVWLSHVFPTVPMWDFAVAGTLVFAIAVLIALAWPTLGTGWLARLTAIGALLVAILPLVSAVQFTIGATLAGSASVLLAFVELTALKPRRSVVASASILLVAGLLVRPMGAAAGALLTGFVLIPWTVWSATVKRAHIALASTLGVASLLAAGILYVDGLLYRTDSSWHSYYRYNWMAAQLAEWGGDLPPGDVAAIRAAAGWTRNDWAMLQRWLASDAAVHGYDRVARAYQAREAAMDWSSWLSWIQGRAAGAAVTGLESITAASMPLAIVITVVAALYMEWRGRTVAALGVFIFCLLCVAIEARFKELPFRLLAPLQTSLAAAVLVMVPMWRRDPSPTAGILGLAVIATLFANQGETQLTAAHRDRQHSAQVDREVREMLRLSPTLVVMHADAFPSEHWWRPFDEPGAKFDSITLGSSSPQLQHYLTQTGRQPIFRAICDDPSIVVVSAEDRLRLVTTYFREHFNRAIAWKLVYDGSFSAWQCVSGG